MIDKISDFVRIGQKVAIKDLKTYDNFYTFKVILLMHKLYKPTFEDMQILINGKCYVKENDEVEIIEIIKVRLSAYNSKHGVGKKVIVECRIKPLTPHKLDW